MSKPQAAFFGAPRNIDYVYAAGRQKRVAELTDLHGEVVTADNLDDQLDALGGLEVIFSTWGMFVPTEAQLDRLDALKAVFYAAGSVQRFAGPFLERGVLVTSAWRSNGRPVAEFTVAQILLANKGYFQNTRRCVEPRGWGENRHLGPGNYGRTVALLGAGTIGRQVIELLQPFHVKLIVFDPYLSETDAASLGVEKVSLEEAFERGDVVSNHLANKEETRDMLDGGLFRRLADHATFINTGRHAQVHEADLAAELERRPTLTALLDVLEPEPPKPDCPLLGLPNAHLSSHIAGSINDEVIRMADDAIGAFEAWRGGRTPDNAVTLDMLRTMA